jgi:protein-disulfide isomerase
LLAGAAMLLGAPRWLSPENPTSPRQHFRQGDLSDARTKGSADAPLTLYEFADFQCPACLILFDSTISHLDEEYLATGKLKIVFFNFPIPELHSNANAAHEFAMCAAAQDRFWPVHDLLFNHQESWAPLEDPAPYFEMLADSAGLNSDSLAACLESGELRAIIERERNAAARAGIRSTPSLVLEGGLIEGAVPLPALRGILDSIYADRTTGQ